MKVKSLSCVRLLATPWTAAHQAPPSMGFSKQEYWSWGAIWNLKNGTNELIYKIEIDTDIENKPMVTESKGAHLLSCA